MLPAGCCCRSATTKTRCRTSWRTSRSTAWKVNSTSSGWTRVSHAVLRLSPPVPGAAMDSSRPFCGAWPGDTHHLRRTVRCVSYLKEQYPDSTPLRRPGGAHLLAMLGAGYVCGLGGRVRGLQPEYPHLRYAPATDEYRESTQGPRLCGSSWMLILHPGRRGVHQQTDRWAGFRHRHLDHVGLQEVGRCAARKRHSRRQMGALPCAGQYTGPKRRCRRFTHSARG